MQRIGQVLKSNGRDGELLVSFSGIAPEDIDTQEPVFIEFEDFRFPFILNPSLRGETPAPSSA